MLTYVYKVPIDILSTLNTPTVHTSCSDLAKLEIDSNYLTYINCFFLLHLSEMSFVSFENAKCLGGGYSLCSFTDKKKEPRPVRRGFNLYIPVSTAHGWSPPEPLTSSYGNKRSRMYAVINVFSFSASCFSRLCSSVVNGKHMVINLLFSFGIDGLPLAFLSVVFTISQICSFYEYQI